VLLTGISRRRGLCRIGGAGDISGTVSPDTQSVCINRRVPCQSRRHQDADQGHRGNIGRGVRQKASSNRCSWPTQGSFLVSM